MRILLVVSLFINNADTVKKINHGIENNIEYPIKSNNMNPKRYISWNKPNVKPPMIIMVHQIITELNIVFFILLCRC